MTGKENKTIFSKTVSLKMKESMFEKLRIVAERKDESMSNVIRDVLQSEINYYEELNEKP